MEEEEAATVVDVEVMIVVDTAEEMIVDTMTVDTEEVEEEATEETVVVDTIHTMIVVDMVEMMVAGTEAAGDTMISKGATVVSLERDKRVEQEH